MRAPSGILRVLAILAALALTVSCGGAASAPAATAATAATAAPAAPAASAAASAAAAPAGLDLNALLAAAKTEGSVVQYTVQTPATNTALKKAFEAKYPGVTLNVQELSSSLLKTKLLAEFQANQVLTDVITAGEHLVFDQNKPQILDGIADLPAYKAFPEKYRTTSYALTSIQVKHILINTKLVKADELKTYKDLTNPKWKGLLAMVDPAAGVLSAQSWYILLQNRFGDDLLKGIAANQPLWQPSGGNIVQAVSAGEKAIGTGLVPSLLAPALKSGAPVAQVTLDPEGGAEIWSAIASKAKHPNAAKLLLNFMMTPEGQAILNGEGLGSSVLPNIPGSEPLSKEYVPTDESITKEAIDKMVKLLKP